MLLHHQDCLWDVVFYRLPPLVLASSGVIADCTQGLGYRGKYSSLVVRPWLCRLVLFRPLVGMFPNKLCGKISLPSAKITKLLLFCLQLGFHVRTQSSWTYVIPLPGLCLLPPLRKSTLLIRSLQTRQDASWLLWARPAESAPVCIEDARQWYLAQIFHQGYLHMFFHKSAHILIIGMDRLIDCLADSPRFNALK